jgi:methionyl-tRNA synthetase
MAICNRWHVGNLLRLVLYCCAGGPVPMKFYVTTQIYDAASSPSIESIYRAVLGDAIARHRRMCGFDVAHLTGTNTPGRRAELGENSWPISALVTQNAQVHKDILKHLDVHGTHFISTDSAEHTHAVQTLLRRTLRHSRHAIYKGKYEGRYCSYDRIDVSGSTQPINCPRCGRATTLISEQRYFFRLSAFRDHLLALYKNEPEFIQPHARLEEIEQLVLKGLTDIAMSTASTSGGIAWPGDPEQLVRDLYSELIAYLSGIGFAENGYGSEEFQQYWPADLHVTSRSGLQPHAIYWPALLMAAGLPLPRRIFAHGALHAESPDWAKELLRQAVAGDFGSDAVRYYLLRWVRYVKDSRVDPKAVATHYQADLAGGLEDLTKRALSAARQYCEGKVPSPSLRPKSKQDIEICVADLRAQVRILLDAQNFTDALAKIWSLVAKIEALLSDALALEGSQDSADARRVGDAVHDACEGIAWLALLLNPILPRLASAIWKALGQAAQLENQLIDEIPWSCLMPGTPLGNFAQHG